MPNNQPRFIAIDSSFLGKWAIDFSSDNSTKRMQANLVIEKITEKNWIPVICLHHLEELARHLDEDIVEKRIRFLLSFSTLAWIGRADDLLCHLGSVVDVLAEEIRTYLSNGESTVNEKISITREKLLRFGKPNDIETLSMWREMQPDMVQMQEKQQEISSICHVAVSENDDIPLSALNKVKGRMSVEQKEKIYDEEVATLTHGLVNKGDKRLSNPKKVSQEFTDHVFTQLEGVSGKIISRRDAFIKQFGFSPKDFPEDITLGEFKKTVTRYRHLTTAAQQLNLDIKEIWPKVKDELFPSEIIISEIRKSRKNSVRASGSDLYDDYLSTLIPYLDVVVVDKRTNEYLNQAKNRVPSIFRSFGSYIKVSSYQELPKVLGVI